MRFVYNADGVPFTVYRTAKATRSGKKDYWFLADYSTGKRRVLNWPHRAQPPPPRTQPSIPFRSSTTRFSGSNLVGSSWQVLGCTGRAGRSSARSLNDSWG